MTDQSIKITITGAQGAGKSTCLKLVAEALRSKDMILLVKDNGEECSIHVIVKTKRTEA